MTRSARLVVLATAFLALLLVGLVARSHAFPEPAPFPIAWEFDFTHGKPTPIAVRGADGRYHWYWYMTYLVTNNTGNDRLFIPEVSLATDKGDAIPAGKGVPASVFAAIKDKLGDRLLTSPHQVVGTLLQGKDFARESVIIWPDFGHDIDRLDIFVAGLSGETALDTGDAGSASATTQPASHPATEPITDASHLPRVFRKTLMISYRLPGTTEAGPDTTVLPAGETWVMR